MVTYTVVTYNFSPRFIKMLEQKTKISSIYFLKFTIKSSILVYSSCNCHFKFLTVFWDLLRTPTYRVFAVRLAHSIVVSQMKWHFSFYVLILYESFMNVVNFMNNSTPRLMTGFQVIWPGNFNSLLDER